MQKLLMASLVFLWLLIGSCFDLPRGDVVEPVCKASSQSLLQRKSQKEILFQDHWKGESLPVEPDRPTKPDDDRFEFCQASPNILGEVASETNLSDTTGSSACNDQSEVALFSPKDSSPYYEVSCCPANKQFCSGCAKLNSGKTACDVCSGGYTKRAAGCIACTDVPGWTNKAGENCYKASCSNDLFQGFSSNSACCKCGGGQAAATKFSYYVGPMALGSSAVSGHPVPRTAHLYGVDKDCELSKYGLTVDATTGELKLSSGCNAVGCGKTETIEVKCTVTAWQSNGLSASAPLTVMVSHLGYGTAVVLRSGITSLHPASGATGNFGLNCVPEASTWLSVDSSTGVLSLKGATSGGKLTEGSGSSLGRGGVCTVEQGGHQAQVTVLAPQAWTSMSYSYGSSTLLYATVGERSPVLPVKAGSGVPPTRYSAFCAGNAFAFDELSGIATFEGHVLFSLDVKTGDLQMQPEESLTKALDAIDVHAVRRKINLQCTILGHYEWLPAGQGPVLTHRLGVELRDQTCWAKKRLSFARRHHKGAKSESDCRSLCRSDATCSHFHTSGNDCYFFSGLCKDSSEHACIHKDVWVFEHFAGCGERGSCIDINLPDFHYVGGEYCPRGENVETTGQGPVYFKQGLTKQETFWLQRYDTARGDNQCASGDWAILKPDADKDYENITMGYVELHGSIVACVKSNSVDLPSDVFGNNDAQLTVKKLSVSGARATVAAPGCQTPNVTTQDKEEAAAEANEQSVYPLVFDDPATDMADDHWLHPCQCVPAKWGPWPPVAGESIADVPAGSNNEFIPPAFQIVEGEFVCEQENLIEIHVDSEDEIQDGANCRTRCQAKQCPYYWEGEVMATKQCRIYSACNELVRELGTNGALYGMSYMKSCRVADPEFCWAVTKRRSMLHAGHDGYGCLYQDLIEQCDHKLMLGGMGVSICGVCTYAAVPGRQIFASNGECMDYDPSPGAGNNVKVHPCHIDANQKWYFEGELLKTDYNDLCLDYNMGNGEVYMHPCHHGANQHWYFDGELLKNRYDNKCLDFQPDSKNIYMGNCPGSNTQHFTWSQAVHGGQQIRSDNNGKCMRVEADGNVKIGDCDVSMANRFYWDGEMIKSEKTGQCLDYHVSVGNIQMYDCHGGSNQRFYWDSKYIKSRHDNQCMDLQHGQGNVYMANCPDAPSQKWRDVDVAKPLPAGRLTDMMYGLCLDKNQENNNVYAAGCHDGNNQKWYFDGELLKNLEDGNCLDENGEGNLYVYPCHGEDNQKFYFDGHRLHNRKWGSAKCGDINGDNTKNFYMHPCHDGANQDFNWEIPRRLKSRKDPGWCLDMNPTGNNVYLHPCHRGNQQMWVFEGPILKVQYDRSRCLDMNAGSSNNLYMHSDCHHNDNQQFMWSGEQIKVKSDTNLCWEWDQGNANNLKAAPCSGSDNQKFFFDSPHYQGLEFKNAASNYCLDVDINGNGNAYMHSCHGGSNQRFIWNGEQLQSEANTNKCLDYSFGSGNVVIWDCHGGNNQKWYWDNGRLKSRHDHFCLDVLPSNNNVFVGSCSGMNTQHWQQLSSLHNSAQLTIGGGKCLRYNAQVHNNVEAAGCSETPGTMWYFNNNHRLQTEENDKCLDVHTSTGNLYMGDCHGGWNQKFYFDGHLLKTMHQDDLCLDYNVANGNVYTGSCPHHNMFNFKMQGGAMLKKMPLPKEYQHGQTLDVSCWSERFASSSSEALSCVAGVWMNSRGKKGLDGFSCAACVQVVTPRYADLDSQIRQELFFAAGMELHLTVDTRIRRSVTANGQLREGGSRDVFVAEMLPDAAETTRRYRSITNGGQCLTMSNGRLGSSACAREAEPQQMIEAMELSSLMWEEFKAGANVPAPTTSYLANRGSGPTTLRSLVLFQFGSGCGDHAMTSLGFNHGTRLGLTASCTPASTYGDHVEHPFDVPGHVQITNVGSGSCLSINQIIPWRLPDRWSGKCMDYDFQGNNVYAGSCHDGNNQLWFMADGQIISLRDLKCLDYHPGTENVYMHECHGGNNQKWYWDEDTAQLRSEYDHRCLDVNMQGSNNIYIHPCHSGNNQKFDRSERSDKAFVMGLHLQCSGFEGEDIKLEPIGGENKFHLRSGPHTLPGEFYYDKNKKRLKNLATNKCLMSHERVTVIEESCAESLEQEWDIGHGLQGLADTPIACESNQVISLFEKGHGHIRYKCVHVSGLGACSPGYSTQVDTKVHELENVKALKRMSATCPAGHGLRSIAAEASDKGAWIRLRYECCQISRIPVSVYPMRAYNPDMAHGWEGVYCPITQDDSGRMQFSQRHSFRPHHGPSGSLTYDKFQGKWCVSGKNCAFSDIVHPLDTMMKTDEWQVVAVSDFDAVFEARGVKPLHSNKKRSPPPLIKFGASDPEYLPECKDESHPGTRTFKLELMNKEAESLDDENACKYVYGKPPKDQAGDGADGMYGWIDDLVSNLGPGQGGVTYKSVKECSDRDIIRELQLAKWSQEHFDKTKYIPLREDAISGLASMVPEVEVAPLGAGVEINDLVEMVGMLILHGAQIKRDQRLSDQEFHFEQAGHDDCNPIQHGFARTFCDLHCIRDAVRKGDDAILRALEEAVEIIGKNTQLLLEHYVGEDSKSGLLEEGQRIKKGIASRMAEMFTMAKEATLEHRASMAATRAINSFTERWRNSTHGAFAMELEELQSTVAELSKRKLSHTDEVQQYALQMANQMGTYLKAQSHVLGIYRHGAEEGKRLQQRLKRVWRSAVSTSAALLEVEEEASEEAMQEFDTMWWDMRRELDSYLGASLDYVHATTAAAQMLRDYSAHCKAGFAELKRSYSHSERAEKKAHRALKKAWTAVTSSLGEMASKVVDGAMFDHLALHDIHSLRLQKSEIKSFCSRSNETFALQLAADALQKGLFGQTQQQLAVLFGELAMLQHRFVSGGLGEAPDLNLVMDAKSRLKDAALQSTLAGGKVAKALVHHFKKSCNLPLPGKETTIPTWNPISTLFQFFKI